MRGTGILPPGRAGLIVIAAVVGSVILQRSKPLARKLGEGLERFGKKLQTEAAEPAPKETPVESEAVNESEVEVQPEAVAEVEGVEPAEIAVEGPDPTANE